MLSNCCKRTFSFLLALVMVFSMLPVPAFAEETGEAFHDHGEEQIIEGYSLDDGEDGQEPDAILPVGLDEEEHVHVYVAGEPVAATCGAAGYTVYTCSCGESYAGDEVPATGAHSYVETVVAPTVEAQGYTDHICSVCGSSYQDNYVDALTPAETSHVHEFVAGETVAPTCTQKGYTPYVCACGAAENRDETDALGHAYQSEVVAPTAEAQGYTQHTCSVCGDSYKDAYTDPVVEQTESVLLKQLRGMAADYVAKFGLSEDMSDQELLSRYLNLRGRDAQAAWEDYEAGILLARKLSQTEADLLLMDGNVQLVQRFYGQFKNLYKPMPMAAASGATYTPVLGVSVKVSGNVNSDTFDSTSGVLTVVAEGTTSGSGCNIKDVVGTATITVTNSSAYAATLSFTYASGEDVANVNIDSAAVESSGTVEKEVAAGKSITVKVTTSETGTSATANLTVSGFAARGTVTFGETVNGSYTVNDAAPAASSTDAIGTTYVLNAVPAEGYVFNGWYENGSTEVSRDNPYTYANNGNVSVAPQFIENAMTVEFAAAMGNGTYTVNGEAAPVTKTEDTGTVYTLVATPNSEKNAFVGWYKDGEMISEDTTIALTTGKDILENCTIYAEFRDLTAYNIELEWNSDLGSVTTAGVWDGVCYEDTPITLTASPASGSTFLGWIDADGKILSTQNPYTFTPTADVVAEAVFASATSEAWFKVGSTSHKQSGGLFGIGGYDYYVISTSDYLFQGLDATMAYAQANDQKGIVLASDGIITGQHTIPADYILLIPYSSANRAYLSTPEFENTTAATPTPYCTVTLANGASLTVDGSLSVSAKIVSPSGSARGGGSPIGTYGYMKLEEGSSITVNSGGNLGCYGYISGEGTITAKSGAKVYEVFQYEDYRGGDQTSQLAKGQDGYGFFPMNSYYVMNILAPLTLEAGATESCYASITASLQSVGTSVTFISSSNAMFNLKSGSVTKKYDKATDRTIITANEGSVVDISSINMSMGGGTLSISINSANYDLPINGNMTIIIKNGSQINVQQDVVMLPGSELIVEAGAKCNLSENASLYIFDLDDWSYTASEMGIDEAYHNAGWVGYVAPQNQLMFPQFYVPERIKTRSAADLTDVKMTIAGTVNASGHVYTTAGGAQIVGKEGAKINMKLADENAAHYQMIQHPTPANSYFVKYTPSPVEGGLKQMLMTTGLLMNADGSYTNPDEEINPTYGATYTYTNGKWVPKCNLNGTESGCSSSQDELTLTCQNPLVCDYCGTIIKQIDHTPGAAATCTTAQTCTVEGCGAVIKPARNHDQTTTIPAVAATCYATGLTEGKKCAYEDCGITLTEQTVTEKIPHTWSSGTQTKAPTCTETGTMEYFCTVCKGADIDEQKTEDIDALGHETVKTDAKDPTCLADGNKEYYTCSREDCGLKFWDEEAENPLADGETTVIPKLEHKYVTTVTKDSTCTEKGSQTTACEHGCNVGTVVEEIPMKDHDMVYQEKKDPTCTDEGLTAGQYCTTCETQTVKQEVISALGHAWDEADYTWSTGNSLCTYERSCTRCSAKDSKTVETSYTETKAPDCTTNGSATYTADFVNVDDGIVDQTKTIVLNSLGHEYGEVTYTWSEMAGQQLATATRSCQRNGCNASETEEDFAEAVTTEATCSAAGKTVYTVVFANKNLGTATKEVEIPILDHDWSGVTYSWSGDKSTCTAKRTCNADASHVEEETVNSVGSTSKAATCLESGLMTHTATFTNAAFEEKTATTILAKLPHAMTHTPAVEPTCLEDGTNGYYTCGSCQYVYKDEAGTERTTVEDEFLTALTHKYDDGVVTLEPTCLEKGVKTFTCQNTCCGEGVEGYSYTVELDALNHSYDNGVVTQAATCTEDGVKTFTCQNASCTEETEGHSYTETISAIGHNWYTQAGTPATCTKPGWTGKAYCPNCGTMTEGEEIPVLDHTWGTGTVTKQPTCEAEGTMTQICTMCAVATNVVTLPKADHSTTKVAAKAATCTEAGNLEHYTCATCKNLFEDQAGTKILANVIIPAAGHSTTGVAAKAATCTEAGNNAYWICGVCDGVFKDQAGKTATTAEAEVIPALNHAYTNVVTPPTCTEDGYTTYTCTRGDHTYKDDYVDALGHTEEIVPGKAATCTTAGMTDGEICSVCKVTLKAQEIIKAKGHTPAEPVKANEVPATCTENGSYDEVVYCSVESCKAEISREKKTVTAEGHKEEILPAVDATCSAEGKTAGKKCTVCGTVTEKQTTVAKLPHTEVIDPAVAPTCTEPGKTEGKHCSVCGETIVAQTELAAKGHTKATDPAVAPTCTEPGKTAGEHCSVCNEVLVPQETVKELGHTKVIDAAVPATCTTAGKTEGEHCSVCNEVLVPQETVKALGHTEVIDDAVAATCTTDGKTEGKHCSVCNAVLRKQETIPAKGHIDAIDAAKAPTCGEVGLTEGRHCSVCNEVLLAQEPVDALGHTEVIDEAVAATCTATGLTEGKHCSVCDEILVAQEVVEKLEHEWDDGRITTLPDCETDGERTFTCGTCNGTKIEAEPALGHEVIINEGKAPTYTSPGWEPYETCGRAGCDHNTLVAIPALGEPEINNFDEFIENLAILEDIADTYVKKVAPGKNPAMLVIKYIRTGVDRYNSGSWNIMAGYEDSDFAEYVRKYEENYNAALAEGEEMMKVSGLKNINEFSLPNGDWADIGHVFGSMDITYTNKTSEDHADVSGWAGDTVDLMSMVDQFSLESTSLEDMIKEINTKYFLKYREDFAEEPVEGTFSNTDMEGDLDAFYVMQTLYGREYENGTLTDIFSSYMTPSLSGEKRAAFFLNNRLDGVTLRTDVREAVYNEYLGNGVVATLEGTRPFNTTDLTELRKACCYVVADYLCKLAGDFIDIQVNEHFTVFQSETSTLAPGIVQKINHATTADGKTMVYYTATGDITNGNVHVYANYHNNDPAAGWNMQRVIDQANVAQEKYGNPESPSYIENYNVIASINGAGYDMHTGEPSGILVMNGVTYHPIDGNGFFAILDDGTARIGTMAEFQALQAERPGCVREAIATFGDLIRNGKIVAAEGGDRASRTAIGITASGKVVFMVLDGRQGDLSCGGNMREIAQIMLEAGCEIAVNLDGGGSSTYVAKEAGATALNVVSNPSDGISRSVSTSLLMVSTAPDSSAFDRAIIEGNYSYFTVNSSDTFTATAVSVTGNVVDMPEGAVWAVSNNQIGTITEDGVFTAKGRGTAEIQLKLDGMVIGSKKINVVNPDNVYFEKNTINAIYGEPIELPVKVAYEGKAVAFNEADVVLSVADASHGTIDGFSFIGDEASGLRSIKVTAALNCDPTITSTIVLSMYTKDEASFDFENANGGDQQLSWLREVSNSNMEGTNVYRSIDREIPMQTTYTFAMDMSQIEMPAQLKDLTYMLPGADVEGSNSAWSFLLQLAERISVLTEVTPVLYFDKNMEVDYSKLSINNEYFYLQNAIFNEEENSLTLVMKWHRQEKPIDIDAANPMCIVTGITLTPKEDATWNSNDALVVVNSGFIGYDIYLRANALYSFSQKPENQEVYGLYPFTNIRDDGVVENGGHFQSVYKEFEDQYTLLNGIKEGWVVEGGGFAYYENDEKYTGICKIDGYYYDFGENGVNIGQKKYTGTMIDAEGNEFYLLEGLMYTGWMILGMKDVKYFNPETGVREKLTAEEVPSTCIIDGHCVYTSESGAVKRIDYDDAGGHEYVQQPDGSHVCSVCGWLRIEMQDVDVKLSFYTCTYNGEARTPGTTATAPDGRVLTKPGQTEIYDYYSTYKNNVDVGTASVTLTATKYGIYSNVNTWRGNAAGSITVTYEIRPDLPTDVKMTVEGNQAVISWNAAKAPGVTYVIYVSSDGKTWTELTGTTALSYSMNIANAEGKVFRIGTRKIVNNKTYNSVSKSDVLSIGTATLFVTTGNTAEGKPKLSWIGVNGAVEYNVYRSNTENGKFARVFTTEGTTYTHVSAVAGNSYYYYVEATLKNGDKIRSETVRNTYSVPTDSFEIIPGNNTDGKPTLKWLAVEGAVEYRVYRSDDQGVSYKYVFNTKGSSYTNVSATPGNTYYYYVIAIKADGSEVKSNVVTNICIMPDETFTITTGNNAEGKPTLKWNAMTNADHYEVYRSTTENGTYGCVFTTQGRTYTHVSATAGKSYYYKVKIVYKDGSENFSYTVTNSCQIPDVMFKIVTGHAANGKPTLRWDAIPGAASYEVYRCDTRDGNFIKTFTTKGTTYTNTAAKAGYTYYYKLKVYLNDGTYEISDVVANKCLIPNAEFNIETGHNAEGKPTLKWTAIAGADHYEVYRANSSGGEYVMVFTTKGTTYTNTSAKAGNTYYYKLKVYMVDGTTKTSEILTNTCLPG